MSDLTKIAKITKMAQVERLALAFDDILPYLFMHHEHMAPHLQQLNEIRQDRLLPPLLDKLPEDDTSQGYVNNPPNPLSQQSSKMGNEINPPLEHHKTPSEKDFADVAYDVGKTLAIQTMLGAVPEIRPLARIIGKTMQTDSLAESAIQNPPMQ